MLRKGGMVAVNPFSEAWKRTMNLRPSGPIHFGSFEVTTQVFLTTPHSFALVNIKPLLPGHVLVCPLKPYKRLTDLSAPEITDLFQTVQRVQRMLAQHYFQSETSGQNSSPSSTPLAPAPSDSPGSPEAGSFNIAIQDGSEAGQTVPHVHVHILPRIRGATEKGDGPGDQIYEQMASEEGNIGGGLWDQQHRPRPGGKFPRIEDAARKARSLEEMEAEAAVFRGVLKQMIQEEDAPKEEEESQAKE